MIVNYDSGNRAYKIYRTEQDCEPYFIPKQTFAEEYAHNRQAFIEKMKAQGYSEVAEAAYTEIKAQEPQQIEPTWLSEFQTMPLQETAWLVDRLIPKDAFILFAGKRASMKTFLSLHMATCIVEGKKVFGVFEVKELCGVLFISEETNERDIRNRLQQIGVNWTAKLAFLISKGIQLDNDEHLKILNTFFDENPDVKLVIVDSFRRVCSIEENDAGAISKLLSKLKQKFPGVSWMFIHHKRKGMPGNGSPDEMDEIRGSSDLSNFADVILTVERKPGQNSVILKQLKNRSDAEIENQAINAVWSEDGKTSVSFESAGTPQEEITEVYSCSQKLFEWLDRTGRFEFRTQEAMKELKKHKFKDRTITNTLAVLVGKNNLKKAKRGHYTLPPDKLTEFTQIAQKPQNAKDAQKGKNYATYATTYRVVAEVAQTLNEPFHASELHDLILKQGGNQTQSKQLLEDGLQSGAIVHAEPGTYRFNRSKFPGGYS